MVIMSWIYLFIAAIFEIGWPFGLKMASNGSNKVLWIIFAVLAMTLSGIFLYLAQKNIPMGTAYAIWTGIGTAGTFILGIILFNDVITLIRILAVILIITGVIILKFQ